MEKYTSYLGYFSISFEKITFYTHSGPENQKSPEQKKNPFHEKKFGANFIFL